VTNIYILGGTNSSLTVCVCADDEQNEQHGGGVDRATTSTFMLFSSVLLVFSLNCCFFLGDLILFFVSSWHRITTCFNRSSAYPATLHSLGSF